MSLKNYYHILGVPPSAAPEDIRSAFRALAKKYHPDKAPENPFAGAHFAEIQEAYVVLSDAGRRAAYDEERWLRGLTNRSDAALRITPEWILHEAERLRKHMATVDTLRMNHAALRDYIASLLRPEHMSVLQGSADIRPRILDELLSSCVSLRYAYTADVARELLLLAGEDAGLQHAVQRWVEQRRFESRWNIYGPALVISFALLICAFIWWLR